jgi:HSP20 family protein
MKADELGVQIVEKTLTISGERKIPGEGENVRYHRREREAGRFSRAIGLPGEIDSEKIEAKMRDGILTIAIPKAEAAKPRQITIN